MNEYKEYTQSFETEIGTVDIIHIFEPGQPVEVQVWVNKSRMYLPERILKQTSQTIIKKVCQTVKAGRNQGLNSGIYSQQ